MPRTTAVQCLISIGYNGNLTDDTIASLEDHRHRPTNKTNKQIIPYRRETIFPIMKRSGFDIASTMSKIRKMNEGNRQQQQQRGGGGSGSTGSISNNKFLSEPVMDMKSSLGGFLHDVRKYAISQEGTQHFEVEARVGVLHVGPRRVTSSGAKSDPKSGQIIPAFVCPLIPTIALESGVSRRHYKQRAEAGLVSDSAIALALGVNRSTDSSNSDARSVGSQVKSLIEETRYIETNFAYSNNRRLVLDGYYDAHLRPGTSLNPPGRWESKTKIMHKDYIVPAANYDVRVSLASEKTTDDKVPVLPTSVKLINHRVKDRASYRRKDGQNPWQIDVTRVTSTDFRNHNASSAVGSTRSTIVYEIEMELQPKFMNQLMNETNPGTVQKMALYAAEKLWDILQHLNPLEETIDVEEKLEPHPNQRAVSLAIATCSALKKFMDDGGQTNHFNHWPILTSGGGGGGNLPSLRQLPGAMPVNFHRADMEKVQVSPDSDYYLSEKTDGVRHFMIFTGDTVVLVDRALNAKRPKAVTGPPGSDPMAELAKLVQPGTVLDGEVVMHRGITPKLAETAGRNNSDVLPHDARPIFDVFDVMMVGATPILQHNFEERFKALQQASFCRNPQSDVGKIFPKNVADMSVAMPMVRKRFVHRREIGDLFDCVMEEKGFRSYRQLPLYNHLTDGVIFQPNTPYKCGTDHDLSKWKYPDTATIDVKLLEQHVYRSQFPGHRSNNNDNDEDEGLELFPVVACQDSVVVDKKRFIHLPKCELYRLNADRLEIRKNIAEVGMDPRSGEWYYLTMRPDKTDANHISTVMGTTYELAEGLDWKELQYTMQLRSGEPNLWAMEQSKMDNVLMETQRLKHQKMDSRKK